jgi:hypothetical protein
MEEEGPTVHVRHPRLLYNSPMQSEPRAENISGRYGSILCPQVVHIQMQPGEPDKASRRSRQNYLHRVIWCG